MKRVPVAMPSDNKNPNKKATSLQLPSSSFFFQTGRVVSKRDVRRMSSWLGKIVAKCVHVRSDDGFFHDGLKDPLMWSHDIGKHFSGEFSHAVLQANALLEDNSQVEVRRSLTYVGVYDGHGGPEASRFIANNLFRNLTKITEETGSVNDEAIKNAFDSTENEFMAQVRRARSVKPLLAAVGSCCLVGVITKGTLYVANLGDSRAVVGYVNSSNKIVAEQLTSDHNASREEIRQDLRSLHPDDPQIVVFKNGTWRVKGVIQVSRSIGDAYLKKAEFAINSLASNRFQLCGPLSSPALTSDPSISTRILRPEDRFLIFASDGLWDLLTNQEAVKIVHQHQRQGIARRLVTAALQKALEVRGMTYQELKLIGKGSRRIFHDDITVVVVFIDHNLSPHSKVSVPEFSVKGFGDTIHR